MRDIKYMDKTVFFLVKPAYPNQNFDRGLENIIMIKQ